MAPPELKLKIAEPPKQIPRRLEIDPLMSVFVTLDDVSLKLTELININLSNEKILKSILKEEKDEADEGEYFRNEGTANTITFDTFDFLGILGFPVKTFTLVNDGANTIQYGHNITTSSIDLTIQTSSARFSSLAGGQSIKISYNRKRIRNIYIKSVGGNSAYKLQAVW